MPRRPFAIFASALIGTAVGTVAGLLLAPDAGSSTRQGLLARASELLDQLPFAIGDRVGQLPTTLDDLRYRLGVPSRPRRIDASFIQLYREGGG